MCYSREAPLIAIGWLCAHLLTYAYVAPTSTFGKKLRPHILHYCVGFIVMEMFDYGLWVASEKNECYGPVGLAGFATVYGTIFALLNLNATFAGFDHVAMMCFAIATVACVLDIIWRGETDTWVPQSPIVDNGYKRNIWFNDTSASLVHVPLYCFPLIRGVLTTYKCKSPGQRLVFQLNLLGCITWVISLLMSFFAWGSIWCFAAVYFLVIYDVHYIIHEYVIFGNVKWGVFNTSILFGSVIAIPYAIMYYVAKQDGDLEYASWSSGLVENVSQLLNGPLIKAEL